jgi:hypothetical protein
MRLIMTLLLMASSVGCTDELPEPPTTATWLKWSEGSEAVFYYDPATITKTGHFRRVWEVQDLRQRDEFFGSSSRRLLAEYDCREARLRHLSITAHSERLAGGKILVANYDAGAWRNIQSATSDAAMLLIVCDH